MDTNQCDYLLLLNFIAGDCSESQKKKLETHLNQCTTCNQKLQTLQKEKSDFLGYVSVDHIISRLETRHKTVPMKTQKTWWLVAACLLLVLSGSTYFFTSKSPDSTFNRLKGTTNISLFVLNDTGLVEQRSTNTFFPYEKIQFTYSSAGFNYFMLLSITSQGSISFYYPSSSSDSSVSITQGADIALPQSIILDDYLGQELFIALFSHSRYSAHTVSEEILHQFNKTKNINQSIMKENNDRRVHTLLLHKVPRN